MRLWDCNWQVVTCMIWPLKGSKEVSAANCLKMTTLHHIESLQSWAVTWLQAQHNWQQGQTFPGHKLLTAHQNILHLNAVLIVANTPYMFSHLKTFQALHFALGHPPTCRKTNTLQIHLTEIGFAFLLHADWWAFYPSKLPSMIIICRSILSPFCRKTFVRYAR